MVDHGSVDSRYHHLSSVVVAQGEWVSAGQLIGYQGQTGNACAEHLHVEWRNDATRQPLAFNNHIFLTTGANKITAGSPIAFHNKWTLASTPTSQPTKVVYFGDRGDIPISGDWNGDGRDSPGFVRVDQTTGNLIWFLTNANLSTVASGSVLPVNYAPFAYGVEGDRPMPGDWDNNNTDTPGAVREQAGSLYWHLSNGIGADPFVVTNWGASRMTPVAGDWNADGVDSPGAFSSDNAHWYLTNSMNPGWNTNPLSYAPWGWGTRYDVAMAGDWQNNNFDRMLVYQKIPDTFGSNHTLFRSSGFPGTTYSFTWNNISDYPIVLNDPDTLDEYAILR